MSTLSGDVRVIDATLREGNQAPGVRFTVDQSRAIATLLARAGVDAIECGHAVVSTGERCRIRAVVELDLGVPVLTHARACIEDIQRAADAGAHWVGIFAAVNDVSRATRFRGRSRDAVVSLIQKAIAYAKRRRLHVRYTLEDASRTPIEAAGAVFQQALAAGADRICYADTVGIATPDDMLAAVRAIREWLPSASLEVHLHDDRGLALAGALKSAEAGAQWISTSVNGIGERCGIVDLCALLANLDFSGVGRGWDFAALQELSAYVGAVTRAAPDARRPVVGRYAFTHTARLHTSAVRCDESAYSWRSPHSVARETAIATAPRTRIDELITRAIPICATELPHHRAGPGTRYVMLDDRFVPYANQYCIVREIPPQRPGANGHVDVHRHNVDSVFVFLGKREGLEGLRVSVTLEDRVFEIDSPSSVLIPGGMLHSYAVLEGEGYFVNFVHAGAYADSLLRAPTVAAAPDDEEGRPVSVEPSLRAPGPQPPAVSLEEFTSVVAQFVSRQSGIQADQIDEHFNYLEAGVLDSLGMLELFFYIEDNFGRQFNAEEVSLERLNTPARFYEFMLTQ